MSAAGQTRLRRAAIECAIVAAIVAASAVWATRYWYASIAEGHEPIFYQEYFEPAVMLACGHGFGVSFAPPPVALDNFLNRRVDQFSCDQLPSKIELTDRFRQKAMKYLLVTVALVWRLLGRISWSALAPLCGLLFGATTAAAYGIFRLGMSRWIAIAGTAALAASTLQLQNAPHLRDYAKAPFALALVLLLGWLVKGTPSWRRVVAIALGAGAVLGAGYGWRSDLLVYIPLFFLTLVLFLDGGIRHNLMLKAAAGTLFLGAFVLTSWPVLSVVSTEGGCEWEVALLGFSAPFDAELRVEPAPYQVSYQYLDEFVYHSVTAYAARRGVSSQFAPCSREFDVANRQYFMQIVRTVPADVVARAYSSVREMWDLPFRFEGPPLHDWFPLLYRARAKVLMNLDWAEPAVIVLALLGLGMSNLRWAGTALLILLYTGGYPALQSNVRHYFHLEFITWWAFGWLISSAIAVLVVARGQGLKRALAQLVPDAGAALRRSIVFGAVAAVILAVALAGLRWRQQRELRGFFNGYISAPKVPLPIADADEAGVRRVALQQPAYELSLRPIAQSALLEFDFDADACGSAAAVRLVYASKEDGKNFSWTPQLPAGRGPGLTRVFFPAYEGFSGVTLTGASPGCLQSASQVADVRQFPLLMAAVLAPGWGDRPLYQQIRYRSP